MSYREPDDTFEEINSALRGFGIGQRGDFPVFNFNGPGDFNNNILYQFDANNGAATSAPQMDRDQMELDLGVGSTVLRSSANARLNTSSSRSPSWIYNSTLQIR